MSKQREKISRLKRWWKNHWDEVVLVVGTILGVILIFYGLGILKW